MFAGIYYGAMYGGSTTAILLNTPGESGSIVTAIDGHEMARQGRGAQALATAAIGSFIAGTIATIALTFVAPAMVKLALLFGPAEYFALMVLALTTVTAVLGSSLSRGLASLFFGFPTFLSYLIEKRLTKHPEEFGHGAIEAVAGPEAANNASAAGTLAPLLSLGLPTSATAAIMLAAFQQYGLQPGPTLFDSNPDLVWGMIASLYIGNVLLLLLNLPMVGLWVKLLVIPRPWLYAGILVFATLGAYTLNNNVVDLVILWIIGLLGFGMRVLDVPVAPCVVGLILGPLAEQQFRRALAISQGDPTVFFTHPLSLGLLVTALLLVLVPVVLRLLRNRRKEDVHARI
jgi:TctA family transporter